MNNRLSYTFFNLYLRSRELDRAGLLNCIYADNTVYLATLSDDGISYLENRFKNGLKDVVKFLLDVGGVNPHD